MAALGAGLGSLAAAPMWGAEPTPKGKRPNIVLFLVDDMGWQDTSLPFCWKDGKPVVTRLNRRYHTPNMERMAREGMLFTDAYAHAICSPSRCSLMSGMNAARHRVTNWTLHINASNDSFNRFEALNPPAWSVNGMQPAGTQAEGSSRPPWLWTAEKGYRQPSAGDAPLPYRMTRPFTNAKGLPAFLKEAGYHTVHCGKAHWGSSSYNKKTGKGSPTPGADPRAFGFDVNIAGCEVGGPAGYRGDNKYGIVNKFNAQEWWVPGLDEGNYYDNDVFLTDALTDESLKAIDRHLKASPGQPFYLHLAHYAIHAPLGNADTWDKSRSDNPSAAKDGKNPNPNDGLPWTDIERNRAVLLKGMDDSLGRVLDFLRKRGLDRDTLVVFMSDNGGQERIGRAFSNNNAPLRAGKGSCYEGGVREPMIAWWPGTVAAGSRTAEPVIIEDFFPTFLEVAGLDPAHLSGLAETPAGVHRDLRGPLRQVIDGHSFLSLLRGDRPTVRPDGRPRPLLWHLPNSWRGGIAQNETSAYDFYSALRLGRWKLIYQYPTRTWELYDLEADLSETTNLAERHPDVVARLRREMGRLLRERNAQMPLDRATKKPVPFPDEA